ncbi:thymidylate kinase-domain-containing protein [Whalleya microplaca]|nr:thymidylate kinase-domain-containing protein [Whalleya microplaca]
MASINDLATAATIASSAVALQSSPPTTTTTTTTQEAAASSQLPAHPQSTPPPPPAPPSTTAAPPPPPLSPSPAGPGAEPRTPGAASASTIAAAPPSSGSGAGPVLAAPQISPQNPSQAQIPAPPAPNTTNAGTSPAPEDEQAVHDNNDGLAVASASSDSPPAGGGDAMDGVERAAPRPVRGAFVVFEGMDRAGKTTQAKLLQLRCVESGREVRFMRFPDRSTPIGQMIDSYLKGEAEIEDHVIHLLFSANRWEADKKIKAELAAGHTVVSDRFYHSGIVYSAAKNNKALSLSWAKAPEVGLPRPDVVLFLDLEEQVARERGGWGGEVYEKGEMQRRVRELFWGLSMGDLGSAVTNSNSSSGKTSRRDGGGSGGGGLGERLGNGARDGGGEEGEFRQEEEDIQIVDADLGVEELSEKVWELVLPRVEAVERGEVGKTVRIVR